MRIWVGLLVMALIILGIFLQAEITIALVFGWFVFLIGVLPRMTVDWGSVAVGAVAFLLLTAGVHWVGRTGGRGSSEGPPRPRWKLRWSLAVVMMICLLFASGLCLIALVHQTVWLVTSGRPLTEEVEETGRGLSTNNLRQIGIGAGFYQDSHEGRLPPGATTFGPDDPMLHGWETHILPFVGYATNEIDFKRPWNDPRNQQYFQCVLPQFINPELRVPSLTDADGYGLSHYAANVHVMGGQRSLRSGDITDGHSTTILIGEVNADFKPWGQPGNWRDPARGINRSPYGFGGAPRSGGANFAMVDGSVRFVSERVNPAVLRALGTPRGGEKIDPDDLNPEW